MEKTKRVPPAAMAAGGTPSFIVDSDEAFNAWADNLPGNDYTVIYVEPGTWNLTEKILNLTLTGTRVVIGAPDSILAFHDTTGPYYSAVPENGQYFMLNVTIHMTWDFVGFNSCHNLYNCKVIAEEGTAYFRCNLLNNCVVEAQYRVNHGFQLCNDLVNCVCRGGIVGFTDCRRLTQCTASGASQSGMSNCRYISNCEVTDCGYGFSGCLYVSNCSTRQCTDRGFSSCQYMANCTSYADRHGYYQCYYLQLCDASYCQEYGFYNCRIMFGCVWDQNGTGNAGCYMGTGTSSPVNATATGGFNMRKVSGWET